MEIAERPGHVRPWVGGNAAGGSGRRTFLAGLLASPLALSACGAGSNADAAGGSGDGGGAFPVTVKHKYGETTVREEPKRIVTVGLTDHDALLALGIAPVATTEWFGKKPGAIWPWAADSLEATGADRPEVLGDATKVNFEGVAAHKPDLILALYSGLTKPDYEKLAAIAPTVAQPGGTVDYGIPWDELTRMVGRTVGKAAEADELIKEIEQKFDAARSEHPEFAGASAVMATPYEGIFVYGPEDPRGRFLTALGFELPAGLGELTGDEFGGDLSEERVDLLDVDAIVWLDGREVDDLGGPVYATLAVHEEGREVFLSSFDDPLGAATSFVSVLSLPFLLDGLVPKLAAAVDGDPDTSTDQA